MPHAKGLTALLTQFPWERRRGSRERPPGLCEDGQGMQEGYSEVPLACFSSRHLPFQEADSQVTAVPKGAGTVGCHGSTGGARGVLTG